VNVLRFIDVNWVLVMQVMWSTSDLLLLVPVVPHKRYAKVSDYFPAFSPCFPHLFANFLVNF
jgi:hypothetical protein